MTFVEAHPLRKFCLRMMEQGLTRYILNVTQCSSMDSTFIGVLAMVSLKGKGRGVRVEICGADEQVQDKSRRNEGPTGFHQVTSRKSERMSLNR